MTTELDELKSALLGLLPMAPDNEKRLWQKFRLEWNFHSNHIEGNTLTYGETELFFLHDRIQAGHTHREYVEMKAHDAAIEHVRELAKEARIIGEGDIRNLNKIALKEPFWKDAITADGQPTKKQVIPGEYKTTPNNVLTATGETFFFARPEETAPKMQEFVAWLAQELASGTNHPVEIAAKCHHDFVLIHPFDDGNGRVARLLVNYVLLRAGFPPVIIRTEKKSPSSSASRRAKNAMWCRRVRKPFARFTPSAGEASSNRSKRKCSCCPSSLRRRSGTFSRNTPIQKTGERHLRLALRNWESVTHSIWQLNSAAITANPKTRSIINARCQ